MVPPEYRTNKGRLIIFEGVDAVGKTTLSEELCTYLISKKLPVRLCHFPGSEEGTLGELVYRIHHLHDSEFGITRIEPCSLQLLHISAHVNAIEYEIKPALENGEWVILDRFWWSTYVYGLDSGVNEKSLRSMIEVEKHAWGPVTPDIVFLINTEKPMRKDEVNSLAWQNKRRAYLDLSNEESAFCKCVTIETVESKDGKTDALRAMLRSIELLT
jgi:thymidylate kinase